MPYTVKCRIGLLAGKQYPVRFWSNGNKAMRTSIAGIALDEIKDAVFSARAVDRTWLASRLFDLLFGDAVQLIDSAIARGRQEPDRLTRVLLEIADAELEGYPWELATSRRRPDRVPEFEIIRWRPVTARLASELPSLPLRVLVADLASGQEKREPFPLRRILSNLLRTPDPKTEPFELTEVRGASRDDLHGLLVKSQFDIVHLLVASTWLSWLGQFGQVALDVPGRGPPLSVKTLSEYLKHAKTRLLILSIPECGAPNLESIAASHFADFARRIVAARGPAALVTPFNNTPGGGTFKFLEEIYAGIVHDRPLDAAVHAARGEWREDGTRIATALPILALGTNSENLLRLSSVASQLTVRSKSHRETTSHLLSRIARLPGIPGPPSIERPAQDRFDWSQEGAQRSSTDHLRELVAAATNCMDLADSTVKGIRSWEHEGGGLLPLSAATRAADNADTSLRNAIAEIERAERQAARVVNSWFSGDGSPIPPNRSLACGRRYTLHLRIGPPQAESHVQNAREIPERDLEPLYEENGIELDVCLYSDDFRPLEGDSFDRVTLRLPRAGASRQLEIGMRVPGEPRRAWLRACIYYRQNLLQSLRVVADVVPELSDTRYGANFADVEFSMSDTLLDVERLPPRTLNILVNEQASGDHTFAVRGPQFNKQYSFPDTPAIEVTREKLLNICRRSDAKGDPVYLFSDVDNSGSKAKFAADVTALALSGADLHFALISEYVNDTLEEDIQALLRKPGAIQISVTTSAKNVFPWAAVYDKKLVESPANRVCPQFLKRIESKTPPAQLRAQSCLDGGCPNASNTDVICPLGFWGFKHTIEQLPPQGGDIVRTIESNGTPRFTMGVHQELEGNTHRKDIEKEVALTTDYCDTKAKIGTSLAATKPHIVYFFCHGGHTDSTPWLGVGKSDHIKGSDFRGWNARWPDTHPIVVINGCHTVDLSPDDILDFVKVFNWCRAAGVIGTEISIPQSFAREFGLYFVPRFAKGETVAAIMSDFRLKLIAKWNVLGLCYTPYCHGDLRLDATIHP